MGPDAPSEQEVFDATVVVAILTTFDEMAADAAQIGSEWMESQE